MSGICESCVKLRLSTYTKGMATVLIVDDNEQNLYMLRVLLETNGHRVLSASQGAQALDLAWAEVPDLAISDILMPIMDGFSFCRHWKSDPLLSSKPFVFYTATYTDARDEAFATSLGADRFLVKPQDPERLLAVVSQLLTPQAEALASPPGETEADFDEIRHDADFCALLSK